MSVRIMRPATSYLQIYQSQLYLLTVRLKKSGNMGSVQIDNYQAMKEVAEYISKKRMQWIGLKIFLDLRGFERHVG